jgi:hypothetical protein
MPGFLETQSSTNQVEAVYVAYFGRAGDGPGFTYWTNFFGSQVGAGKPTAGTAIAIADSFAVQPEALAKYSLLATPPNLTNTTSPVTIASVQSFINTVYQDLFGHAADATGLAFWQNAILTSKVSIGSAVYIIANGATGNDATILTNKITAAVSFTTDTVSFNTPVNSTLLTAAGQAVTPVGLDPATVSTSQTFSMQFAQTGTLPNTTGLILTPNADTLTTSAAHAIFSAPLVPGGTEFVGATNVNLQTLTVNDSLTDTANDGTLNATFAGQTNVTPAIVANVTMQGIATANLINVSGDNSNIPTAPSGFEGNVTGLTTVSVSNSNQGVQLGVVGAGLNTALKSVSVVGFTGANGSDIFTGVIAAKAGSASNTIAVSLSGKLGDARAADVLTFSTDGPAGTKANPNTAYGTWALTVNSNANLELVQGGVGGATTLQLLGAGAVALGADAASNWQKLTSIDASGSTGNVTITGHLAGMGFNGNFNVIPPIPFHNASGSTTDPTGLFGSAAGLLDGNTALTSYKLSGGTGVNILDVSSFSTTAELGALTTTVGTNTATTNEIIVTSLVADTTSASTFANIAGFQILGVVGPGDHTADTGTITWSNLPTSFNEIIYQTPAHGDLTINAAPATLTVDTEDNGNNKGLTVNSTAASSVSVIVGSATFKTEGHLGDVTLSGAQTETFTAQGGTGAHDAIGSVQLTPASLSGTEAVTITGTSSVTFGAGGASDHGAIIDVAFGVTPPALNVNNLTITDTDTGITTFEAAFAGPLFASIPGNTPGVFPIFSTNALTIDAHASGGLLMQGGDANFSTLTNTGDTIIGSATASNILIGSIGNDVITGTTSTTVADTVDTGGGADKIALAPGHTVADQVDLYGGSTVLGAGNPTNGSFSTVVNGADEAQLGWWGIHTNGAHTAIIGGLFAASGGGTSADMSTVSGFTPGTATAGLDSVNISLQSFSFQLHDTAHGGTQLVAPQTATFSADLVSGSTVPAGTSSTVLVFGTEFADAAALSALLAGPGTVKFAQAQLPAIEHFIGAYTDLSGNVRIADIDLHTKAGGSLSFADGSVAVSDMVQLTGVSLASLHNANIHFVA